MQKWLWLFLILFAFLGHNTAQNGTFTLARYGENEAPKLSTNDPLTEFSGGFQAFKSLFFKEFKLPRKAFRNPKPINGMVGFTVNTDGKLVDIEIIDSITPEIDAEVIRVLAEIANFQPQTKPLKFALQYNVYPDWLRDWAVREEAYKKQWQQATDERQTEKRTIDSLLKSLDPNDLAKYVNKDTSYVSGGFCVGVSTKAAPLGQYLKTGIGLGLDFGLLKRNWFFLGNMQFRSQSTKQDFAYKTVYWEKDSFVSLITLGAAVGYELINNKHLIFTPFVSLGGSLLSLKDTTSDKRSNIGSFTPSFGFCVDFKKKVSIKDVFALSPSKIQLNTTFYRLRLAVNPMNFHEKLQGNVFDIGIGFGYFSQFLKFN